MGYYYDWLERQWLPRHPRALSPREQRQRDHRAQLLRHLLNELQEDGDSVSQLYAGLLARSLISGDEELMRAFGKEVAERCEGAQSRTNAA
jgi:hypothetical protein